MVCMEGADSIAANEVLLGELGSGPRRVNHHIGCGVGTKVSAGLYCGSAVPFGKVA